MCKTSKELQSKVRLASDDDFLLAVVIFYQQRSVDALRYASVDMVCYS